jgi:hypothetical protein
MLSEGAAQDPWRPHNVPINWDGETKRAFELLANPPGIAWYLLPVRLAPEWVLHLWMQPWLLLGAGGCYRLASHFASEHRWLAMMFLLTTPVIVLSAHALTPDLPVFACVAAGVGGFLTCPQGRWRYALLAGCATLFRYSGITMIPLLMAIGWRHGGWRGAIAGSCAAIPLCLLILHDWHAYGEIHFLAMAADQNDQQERPFWMAAHNVAAGIAMLGGAGVLPILVWRRASIAGAILGAGLGLQVAYLSNHSWIQAIPTVLCLAGGMATLSLALSKAGDWDLFLWSWGGAAFFGVAKFAATRYWTAFLPGAAFLAIRNGSHNPRWLVCGIVVNVLISLGMAIDDQELARGYQQAAFHAAAYSAEGTYGGHWGWQHYLSKSGWSALEAGTETGPWHAHPLYAEVQLPSPESCLRRVEQFPIQDKWWGPRIMSHRLHAWYHAGGYGSYAPWTLSDEPYDIITIYRRCDIDTESGQEHTHAP